MLLALTTADFGRFGTKNLINKPQNSPFEIFQQMPPNQFIFLGLQHGPKNLSAQSKHFSSDNSRSWKFGDHKKPQMTPKTPFENFSSNAGGPVHLIISPGLPKKIYSPLGWRQKKAQGVSKKKRKNFFGNTTYLGVASRRFNRSVSNKLGRM